MRMLVKPFSPMRKVILLDEKQLQQFTIYTIQGYI